MTVTVKNTGKAANPATKINFSDLDKYADLFDCSTEEPEETPGRRLERYVKGRWTRRNGGILALAGEINSSTETIYSWFRGDSEPSMAHLRAVADKLGVRRAVLVAVLDGDPLPGESDRIPESLELRLRAIEAELQSLHAQPAAEGSPVRSAPHARAG